MYMLLITNIASNYYRVIYIYCVLWGVGSLAMLMLVLCGAKSWYFKVLYYNFFCKSSLIVYISHLFSLSGTGKENLWCVQSTSHLLSGSPALFFFDVHNLVQQDYNRSTLLIYSPLIWQYHHLSDHIFPMANQHGQF